MGRPLRSQLDLMIPSDITSTSQKVQESQERQKAGHNVHTRPRSFVVGDTVSIKNIPGKQPPWIPGQVTDKLGVCSYKVQLEDGRVVRRHVDDVNRRHSAEQANAGDDPWEMFPSPQAPEAEMGQCTAAQAFRAGEPSA